jgi:hypothetical protein
MFFRIFTIGFIVLAIAAGCKKTEYLNETELIEGEEKLLKEFFESDTCQKMMALGDTVMDRRDSTGIMIIRIAEGIGDSIKEGQTVGYRYSEAFILLDSIDKSKVIVGEGKYKVDNYSALNPVVYIAGSSDFYNTNSINPGVDEAILTMKKYGKVILIMPSSRMTVNNRDYYSRVYELEVSYISK